MASRATAAPALGDPGTRTSEHDRRPAAQPGPTTDTGTRPSCGRARTSSSPAPCRSSSTAWPAGQPVMVAVIQPRIDLLRAALGPDAAAAVVFVDMAELGRNPARIIPAWRGFLDEHGAGGRPVRGIGEPIWAGRRPAEVTECQFHEALLNLAVEPHVPLWLLCPYDVEALAPDVVTEAHRSHPALVDVDSYRGSTLYGGSHHVRTVFASDAAPIWRTASCRRLLRRRPGRRARGRARPRRCRGGAGRRSADLALAVHEVAANSLEHAPGTG